MSAAQQTQINHEVKEQKLQKDITMTFISCKGICLDRYCRHTLHDKIHTLEQIQNNNENT